MYMYMHNLDPAAFVSSNTSFLAVLRAGKPVVLFDIAVSQPVSIQKAHL